MKAGLNCTKLANYVCFNGTCAPYLVSSAIIFIRADQLTHPCKYCGGPRPLPVMCPHVQWSAITPYYIILY